MKTLGSLLILTICLTAGAIEKSPAAEFRERRNRVAAEARDGLIVLFAPPETALVEYYPERNFYYLTGFVEAGAILLVDGSVIPSKTYFFVEPRNPKQEQWTGIRAGIGAETERALGIPDIQTVSQFPDLLKKLAKDKAVYSLPESFDRIRSTLPNTKLNDIRAGIAKLRQVKSDTEIKLLEKAIQITNEAQAEAARTIAPAVMEYEVEAALEYVFRRNGAERPGFPSIVGSGPLSTVLHYDKSSRRMQEGEVVVVDIGAEYSGYSADVTRTYPVSGTFSPRQREIYQIVLDAQKAAIADVRPGATLGKIHTAAMNVIKSKGYAQYFIHGTSHHIGLEVHDVGSTDRTLEANMVITVEPWLYIHVENLGVRIEDDILVTPEGFRVLSNEPKEIPEVEALVQKSRAGRLR